MWAQYVCVWEYVCVGKSALIVNLTQFLKKMSLLELLECVLSIENFEIKFETFKNILISYSYFINIISCGDLYRNPIVLLHPLRLELYFFLDFWSLSLFTLRTHSYFTWKQCCQIRLFPERSFPFIHSSSLKKILILMLEISAFWIAQI